MTKKEIDFRLAVKAFIVQKDKLLILKRADDDPQKPNIWELPGGRLELGEDPVFGLMREVKEETGLYATPQQPLNIRHFTRDDNQIITMIIFLCKTFGGTLKLSKEHSEFEWIEIKKAKQKLADFFHKEINIYQKSTESKRI
jgi:8-oxo-dGTP diphosphatase